MMFTIAPARVACSVLVFASSVGLDCALESRQYCVAVATAVTCDACKFVAELFRFGFEFEIKERTQGPAIQRGRKKE